MRTTLRHRTHGLPPVFWWIWLSILVNWAGAFARPVLALSVAEGHGGSAAYAGFVIALIGFGGVLGTVAGSLLADRLGRRPTLVLAHCVTAVAMAALGTMSGHWVEVAAFAVGLGSVAARPAMNAALIDLVPARDRQRAFALNYWAVNAGIAVSAVLTAIMVAYGYQLIFLADAGATLVCAMIVLLKVPETRPVTAARTAKPVAAPSIRLDRRFLIFLLATLAVATVYEQSSTTMPIVMVAGGLGAASFGFVQAINGALIVLLQIPLTRWARHRSRTAILLGSALLIGWGFGLNAFAHGFGAYVIFALFWTIGEILQLPTGSAVVADRAPHHLRGRYAGLYTAAWSGAALLGPAGGGWVLDHWGATTVWICCALLGTLAAAGFALTAGGRTKLPHQVNASPVRAGENIDSPQNSTNVGGATTMERIAP